MAAQLRSQSRNLLLRVDPGNCVADDPGWALLEAELLAIQDFPDVVVVDGIGVLPTSELAFLLLELLRRVHGPRIQLILTCRRVQKRFNATTHDASPWMISSSELRFTLGQVAALAQHVLQRQLEDEDLQTLALASGRQPALLLLLLRHISVSNVSIEDAIRQSPGDVVGNLEESIELEGRTGVLDALGVAALLGSGSVKQLVMLSGTNTETIAAAAQVAPLLRVTNDSSGSPRFDMHDLACDVYGQAALARWWSGSSGSIEAIETELAFRGDFHRLFRLLIQSNRLASLVAWTEKLGGLLLEDACLGLLACVLDHIPTRMQAGSVRLLLVGAMLLRCQGQTTEALKRVITARQLASAQCDDALERECLMAEARLRWDLAQYGVLLPQLTRAHQRALLDKDQDTATLTSAYLASAYAQLGDVRQGREYVEVYQSIYRLPGVRASTRAQTVSMVLLVLGVVCGDLASASEVLKVLRNEAGLPRDSRLLCEGNLAALLMGMGRVQAARDIAAKVRGSLSASGLNVGRVPRSGVTSARFPVPQST
ncbi:MAG: hypothetical protein Q8S43_02455 [Actinomycetota bacterium]|nr:hypothetical protein [Actinomycetota bacterium]